MLTSDVRDEVIKRVGELLCHAITGIQPICEKVCERGKDGKYENATQLIQSLMDGILDLAIDLLTPVEIERLWAIVSTASETPSLPLGYAHLSSTRMHSTVALQRVAPQHVTMQRYTPPRTATMLRIVVKSIILAYVPGLEGFLDHVLSCVASRPTPLSAYLELVMRAIYKGIVRGVVNGDVVACIGMNACHCEDERCRAECHCDDKYCLEQIHDSLPHTVHHLDAELYMLLFVVNTNPAIMRLKQDLGARSPMHCNFTVHSPHSLTRSTRLSTQNALESMERVARSGHLRVLMMMLQSQDCMRAGAYGMWRAHFLYSLFIKLCYNNDEYTAEWLINQFTADLTLAVKGELVHTRAEQLQELEFLVTRKRASLTFCRGIDFMKEEMSELSPQARKPLLKLFIGRGVLDPEGLSVLVKEQ